MRFFDRYWSVITLVVLSLVFFRLFFFAGKLPVPSDTIVGLYHPFRDLYREQYPNGIPYKNFLITDPVRQQYPWRQLAVTHLKRLELPLWNPYSFSGTPLWANMQSASLYPLNIPFFIFPFQYAWALLVVLQPILAGVFLYLYLRHIRVHQLASLLGSFVFAFSGFGVAWLEWNTVLHVGLWLPMILLSVDKIFSIKNSKWPIIFILSLASSFLAGHLQTFFYVLVTALIYFCVRWYQRGRERRLLFRFTIYYLLFTMITFVQWLPTFQFILQSAREVDQINWQQPGWFIPWQHLIQFVVPDFFGNPTTLNYWGVWNYAEFIGYVGVAPLILGLFALFFRRDKKTLFFGSIFFLSLIFALSTFLAKLPYTFRIPLVSTSQPTRLLFLTDFSLAVLAAFGLDYFMKSIKKREIVYPLAFLAAILAGLWFFVNFEGSLVSSENLLVAKRNLYLPTLLFTLTTILFFLTFMIKKQKAQITLMIYIIIVGVTAFDLLRFGLKFTPFTNREYLFPDTKALSFLKSQEGQFRIMSTDRRILPPNFSMMYRLQSVDGYDPLYLRRYAELIAASERGKPNIDPPFGFNRIITPHNYDSKIIDLLGVKYVLSLSDLSSPKLKKIIQEGQTRVYENTHSFPRTFFVERVHEVGYVDEKEKTMQAMFEETFDLRNSAVIELEWSKDLVVKRVPKLKSWSIGKSEITHYAENKVIIETENSGDGFLVLTDTFYPTWRARVDGRKTNIYRTDYNFRGVYVSRGKHTIEFYNALL